MFNLIISIIAIALVVVLAGASLYYGGSAFNEGSSDAKAATLINQAQQIQASATLYSATEGGAPTSIADLDGDYLSALPVVPVGDPDNSTWELEDSSDFNAGLNIDIVAVELAMGAKADEGITTEICATVNDDGAGVVFCHAEAVGGGVLPGGGNINSIDTNTDPDNSVILGLDPTTSAAVVYMSL